ncbi:hypothetical protein SAMN05421854_110170 [Amycolatopsis rubida]|uniref:HTH cro/C1-type domain-containing protein n=2 Tax=Amycolatopsis rubida TaxID=112413 RepID=A0A1I5XDJ4_9PSEU|nr:hypothetical protein SAMN05421854_110170 [Amycolatopsis rubida]
MEQPGRGSTIAERLNYLINLRPESEGGPWSDLEIAEGIEAQGLGKISAQTVWRLRTGRADDPKVGTLSIVARFFGVNTGYFTDDDPSESVAEIRYLLAHRDGELLDAMMRMGGLSNSNFQTVNNMIGALSEAERKHGRTGAGDASEGKGTSTE